MNESAPRPRLALTLVVGGLGMGVVGWGAYTLTTPGRPATPVAELEAEAAPGTMDSLKAAGVVTTAPRWASPEHDPNRRRVPTPKNGTEPDVFVPTAPPLDAIQRRSVASFLDKRPDHISPENLEKRATKALDRLADLPDPPLRPGSDDFMDYVGIWDEIDRMRSTATYLAGDAGHELDVDVQAYREVGVKLDAIYADGQRRWAARQARTDQVDVVR